MAADTPFLLIPTIPEDAPLHPAAALAEKMPTASDITAVLNRIGKKNKKPVAWLVTTMAAAVRSRLGKSPADLEAMMTKFGYSEAVAKRAAGYWRLFLTLRDAMEANVRGWSQSDTEKAVDAGDDLRDLLPKPENQAAVDFLRALLSLTACCLGSADPDALGEDILADEAVARIAAIGTATMMVGILLGYSSKYDEVDEEEEDAGAKLTENGYTETAEKFCSDFLPKLAPSNQVFLAMSLKLFIQSMTFIFSDRERARRCRRKAEMESTEMFHALVTMAQTLEDFSKCLAFHVKDIDMSKVRLPNPKTEDAAVERCEKLAASISKAFMQVNTEEGKALRGCFFGMNHMLALCEGLTEDEHMTLQASMDKVELGYFPMCIQTLSYVAYNEIEHAKELAGTEEEKVDTK